MNAKVIGVHDVEANEPVCLIELAIEGNVESFKIDEITQEDSNAPRMNWQAAYDEQILDNNRITFFFHYLDQTKPLLTSFGALTLPTRTAIPEHLKHIHYEKP